MKHHRTAGLDQLGPTKWHILPLPKGSKVKRVRSINDRASQSSKGRKVKITLATTPYRWEEH